MNNAGASQSIDTVTEPAALQRRFYRSMVGLVAAATTSSIVLAGWQFTLGLLLGGVLALFNYRWLHSSLTGILAAGNRKAPPGTMLKFVFRWLVVGALAYVAYRTGYFDPIGILAGLLTPAAAALIEAGYVTYRTLDENRSR